MYLYYLYMLCHWQNCSPYYSKCIRFVHVVPWSDKKRLYRPSASRGAIITLSETTIEVYIFKYWSLHCDTQQFGRYNIINTCMIIRDSTINMTNANKLYPPIVSTITKQLRITTNLAQILVNSRTQIILTETYVSGVKLWFQNWNHSLRAET